MRRMDQTVLVFPNIQTEIFLILHLFLRPDISVSLKNSAEVKNTPGFSLEEYQKPLWFHLKHIAFFLCVCL